MKKRNAFLVIALMMLFGLNINITNVKAKTITYDYKDTMFGTRTKEEVAKEYSKAINAGSDTYRIQIHIILKKLQQKVHTIKEF